MDEYLEMLCLRWHYNSLTFTQWRQRFLEPLGGTYDPYGNYLVQVGDPNGLLFSCHIDTVPGTAETHTSLAIDPDGIVYRAEPTQPLGADDTNGVWLMRQLIHRGFNATYLFHRDEEIGLLGANWLAQNQTQWLAQFHTAIALDRRGYADIVTHMAGQRTCSDTFAWYLADALAMYPNPNGGRTDVACYNYLIANCTNISVGYFAEHSPHEYSNFHFLKQLLDKLLCLDPKQLASFYLDGSASKPTHLPPTSN
ncbi:MAG: hypothetical protein NZM04_00480 [Methylacidiphilales bacterium]|nr:hypothetical protein [Candidatus Methylacidiphilales bacterium]